MPIDRYSFETVELMKDWVEIASWRHELLVERARLAGATEAQARASVPRLALNVLDVSFDAIRDPKERAHFLNLPTSFALPARMSTDCARSRANCCDSPRSTTRSYAVLAGRQRNLFQTVCNENAAGAQSVEAKGPCQEK